MVSYFPLKAKKKTDRFLRVKSPPSFLLTICEKDQYTHARLPSLFYTCTSFKGMDQWFPSNAHNFLDTDCAVCVCMRDNQFLWWTKRPTIGQDRHDEILLFCAYNGRTDVYNTRESHHIIDGALSYYMCARCIYTIA